MGRAFAGFASSGNLFGDTAWVVRAYQEYFDDALRSRGAHFWRQGFFGCSLWGYRYVTFAMKAILLLDCRTHFPSANLNLSRNLYTVH